jgi:hypothetical protein
LLQALIGAAKGNVRREPESGMFVAGIRDITIIRKLLTGGADLELDILPGITTMVTVEGQPAIPRWDLPWLVDEIRRNTQARGEPDPYPPAAAIRPALRPAIGAFGDACRKGSAGRTKHSL